MILHYKKFLAGISLVGVLLACRLPGIAQPPAVDERQLQYSTQLFRAQAGNGSDVPVRRQSSVTLTITAGATPTGRPTTTPTEPQLTPTYKYCSC